MKDKSEKMLEEILARTRRIETRQVVIAQGGEPLPNKVRFMQDGDLIQVSGLDVSIGELIDYLRTSGNSGSVLLVSPRGEFLLTVTLSKQT